MKDASPLQPTLWRSCRVLANRQRLRLLELLAHDSELTVTSAAQRLALPLPVASQYLRALEARGFLQAHRRGRRVSYRLSPRRTPGWLQPVVNALREGFRHHP
jgi:DNA-binding transcriptional ArsR family regulator